MSAHWWWSWSIGLPSTAYNNAGFVLTSTANISTNNTTTLFTPAPGSLSPSEEFHLRTLASNEIRTPIFSSITEGWLIFRYRPEEYSGTVEPILKIQNTGISVIEIGHSSADLNTHFVSFILSVNGSLIGTSQRLPNRNAVYVMAIDFDVGASTPEAGLVINGIREVNRGSGSGSATTINNIQLGTGCTGTEDGFFGDIAIFNDLSNLTDRSSQDVWVTFLDPDTSTDGDNSWTPSAGSDLTAVNDASATTFTQTTTSPDSITYGFESCNTRQSGWSPTLVYGVAVIAYASADTTQTDTTLTLIDNVPASAGSTNVILTTTNTFLGVWTAVDSAAAAWTTTSINASTATYSVA